jgi:hypothetical protein
MPAGAFVRPDWHSCLGEIFRSFAKVRRFQENNPPKILMIEIIV